MNYHEQMMCEMQADFFELSQTAFSCSSSFFIARYMYSDVAKDLDKVDDYYNYISPNNLVSILSRLYPSLNNEHGQKYPIKVLRWIGYIYRAFSIIKKIDSCRIYKSIKAEKMLSLYDSFHTFSVEYCINRLEEIINEKVNEQDDYEIFKQVVMSIEDSK